MATNFQKDLGPGIEPAQGDTGKAVGAWASARTAVGAGLVQAAKTAYETKKYMDTQDMSEEARNLRDQFHAQETAKERLQAATAARDQTAKSLVQAESFLGPQTPEQSKEYEAKQATLGVLTDEMARLKDAAAGGMSNDQFYTRMQAISNKYIAKYPGLADEIRQKIGQVTGLPGGPEWAARQFVQERFDKKTGGGDSGEEKAIAKDITDMSAGGFGSRESLTKLYNEDNVEFQRLSRLWQESNAAKNQKDFVANQAASEKDLSNKEALRRAAGLTSIVDVTVGGGIAKVLQNKDNYLFQASKETDENKINTLVQMHSATIKQIVEEGRIAAKRAARDMFNGNPNIDKATRDDILKQIDDQAEFFSTQYGDKNAMVTIGKVMADSKDKSLNEQFRLVSLAIQQMAAMGNNPLVNQYWEGDKARENLKTQFPAFYKMMEQLDKNMSGAANIITNTLTAGSTIQKVAAGTTQVERTGQPAPPTGDVAIDKACADATVGRCAAALDGVLKDQPLTEQDRNAIKGSVGYMVNDGAGAVVLRNNIPKFQGAFNKMDQKTQLEVAYASSEYSVSVVDKLAAAVAVLNEKGGDYHFQLRGDGAILLTSKTKGINSDAEAFNRKYAAVLQNLPLVKHVYGGVDLFMAGNEYVKQLNQGKGLPWQSAPEAPPTATPATGEVVDEVERTGKVSPADQKRRDADARTILRQELDKTGKALAQLDEGTEEYARKKADIEAIKLELDRLPK